MNDDTQHDSVPAAGSLQLPNHGDTQNASVCTVHNWCAMSMEDPEHRGQHAGDPVDLAGSDNTGWWGWLVEDGEGAGPTVRLESADDRLFSIPAATMAAVFAATATPIGRAALVGMLRTAGFEPTR